MTNDVDQLTKLNIAAFYLVSLHAVRRSGWWGLGSGALVVAVATWFMMTTDRSKIASILDLIGLTLGILLMVTGAYLTQNRKPWLMLIQGSILGALAIFYLALFGLSWYTGQRLGGHPLVGIILGTVSFSTFQGRSPFSFASREVDPSLVPYVDGLVQRADRSADPQIDSLLSFKIEESTEESTDWRGLLGRDAVLFMSGEHKGFSRKIVLTECFFVLREDLLLEQTGDTGTGKDKEACFHIKDKRIEGVRMEPLMFERLQNWLGNPSLSAGWPSLVGDSYSHNSVGTPPL